MTDFKDAFKKELEDLARVRDELRLKAHLGKAEAKDLWHKLEGEWPKVEQKIDEFEKDSAVALQRLLDATKDAVAEIKKGYAELDKKDE